MKRSDKQGLKTKNQVIDRIGQLLERYQDRMTFDNVRIAERYAKGQIHILVHFRVDGKKQVASFSGGSKFWDTETNWTSEEIPILVERFRRKELETSHANIGYEKGSVLICDVEFVNNPQGITLPALIRFGSVNGVYSVLRHALYFSEVSGLVFVGVLENGIVNMPARTGTQRRTEPQLKGEMIQAAPEIVDNVADNEIDLVGSRPEIMERVKLFLSSLRIVLSSDSVGLSLQKEIVGDL